MNSFKFIHCFPPKQSKRSISFIYEILENGTKVQIFILLGFNDNKMLNYFYLSIFCSGRAFQRYIDNDSTTVGSDMISKNILVPLMFGQTLEILEFHPPQTLDDCACGLCFFFKFQAQPYINLGDLREKSFGTA